MQAPEKIGRPEVVAPASAWLMMTNVRKSNLPTKLCPVCRRPFVWRKKWARVWEEVRYCSERCRRNRSARG